MSQKLSYSFKNNGWDLKMVLTIEFQKPVDNTIKVNWCIIGISEGEGTINIKEGKLYTDRPVVIKPYNDEGKPKTISIFKVEKFRMLQINEHLS